MYWLKLPINLLLTWAFVSVSRRIFLVRSRQQCRSQQCFRHHQVELQHRRCPDSNQLSSQPGSPGHQRLQEDVLEASHAAKTSPCVTQSDADVVTERPKSQRRRRCGDGRDVDGWRQRRAGVDHHRAGRARQVRVQREGRRRPEAAYHCLQGWSKHSGWQVKPIPWS